MKKKTTPQSDAEHAKSSIEIGADELGLEITSLHPHVKEVPRAVRISRYMAPKTSEQQKK